MLFASIRSPTAIHVPNPVRNASVYIKHVTSFSRYKFLSNTLHVAL